VGIKTILILSAIMALGLFFTAYSIHKDLTAAGTPVTSYLPFLLLGVALLIALGFEFVNGFHDTANAVATVIYTHSLAPPIAVVWSGCFNFLGVLFSTGAVAFGIVSLLPVELIMQVGSEAGFAMVFAMLIAAIIWKSRHMVARAASVEFAYFDRFDHRRRRRQCADARARWNIGGRLEQGR
jgi:PiT family inorganic phosphate transporter